MVCWVRSLDDINVGRGLLKGGGVGFGRNKPPNYCQKRVNKLGIQLGIGKPRSSCHFYRWLKVVQHVDLSCGVLDGLDGLDVPLVFQCFQAPHHDVLVQIGLCFQRFGPDPFSTTGFNVGVHHGLVIGHGGDFRGFVGTDCLEPQFIAYLADFNELSVDQLLGYR